MRPSRCARTIATLTPVHLAELRLLHVNPRHPLQPQRRDMFSGLGLIKPAEPPRAPHDGRRRVQVRVHVLTTLGEQTIGVAQVEMRAGNG